MPGEFTKCNCCGGTGRIRVTGVYAETLCILRRRCHGGGFVVANQDAFRFDCKPTALNNRLAWLERHGFATSSKFGRQRRYVAKERSR